MVASAAGKEAVAPEVPGRVDRPGALQEACHPWVVPAAVAQALEALEWAAAAAQAALEPHSTTSVVLDPELASLVHLAPTSEVAAVTLVAVTSVAVEAAVAAAAAVAATSAITAAVATSRKLPHKLPFPKM